MNNRFHSDNIKKVYQKPEFEIVEIDIEISLIMQSPGGDPDPGSSSSGGGGDDW